MIYRWIDVNADLNVVTQVVKEFFETRGFKTAVNESEAERMVMSVKRVNDETRTAFVKISGKPEDFWVELLGNDRSLQMLGSLTTLFGLGAFLRREMKNSGFLESLEREFWVYMEDAEGKFRNSRSNPKPCAKA